MTRGPGRGRMKYPAGGQRYQCSAWKLWESCSKLGQTYRNADRSQQRGALLDYAAVETKN